MNQQDSNRNPSAPEQSSVRNQKKERWTEEQKKALDLTPKNRIVSAQAGAGKTGVLVERILREITERDISLDRMLIVTFTKKAAGEMRNRIRKGLLQRLQNMPEKRALILSQMNLIASANIQTLHAFCLEILRQEFDRLNLDPTFSILSEPELRKIQEEAMEELLQDAYSGELTSHSAEASSNFKTPTWEELSDFLECYGDDNRRSDRRIQSLIREWHEVAEGQPDPNAWSLEALRQLTSTEAQKEWFAYACDFFVFDVIARIGDEMAEIWRQPVDILPEKVHSFLLNEQLDLLNQLLSRSVVEDNLQQALREIRSLRDLSREEKGSLLTQWQNHLNYTFQRFPSVGKNSDPEVLTVKDKVMTHRVTIKKELWSKLSGFVNRYTPDVVSEEQQKVAGILQIIAFLSAEYEKRIQTKKREWNGIDFNDSEHLMLRLLQREDVRPHLQQKYREIYFDEYQDANPVQEAIVEALSSDRNLFFVGDVKQSIYQFRHAQPENFVRRMERYRNSNEDEVIDLTRNFRSDPAILDFVNCIFSKLMTTERGGVDYDTPSHRARSGNETSNAGEVTLCLVKDEKKAKQDEKDHSRLLDEMPSEPFYVAATIQDYVQSGGYYQDCVLLARSRTHFQEYQTVFRYLGIPLSGDSNRGEEEPLEWEMARNLLSYLDNPLQDIPLLCALLSSVGGFTEEELAQIRLLVPEGPFYQAFREAALASPSEEERQKVENFLSRCERWRRERWSLSLTEWMESVFEEAGILSYAAGTEEGQERVHNLLLLLTKAEEYENRGKHDLAGFLESISGGSGKQAGSENPNSVSEGEDVVRLMTIHQSKGLQFPIVFLVGLGSQFGFLNDRSELFAHDDSFGVSIEIREKNSENDRIRKTEPLSKKVLKEEAKRMSRSEEVRVLYVAMTRAQKALYLVGQAGKRAEKKTEDLLCSTMEETGDWNRSLNEDTCYLQWILRIMGAHPEHFGSHFHLVVQDGEKVRNQKPIPANPSQAADTKTDAKRIFAYQYPTPQLVTRPMKFTVSQLSDKNEILDPHFKRWPQREAGSIEVSTRDHYPLPNFMLEEQEVDAATFGTLMHRALQNVTLKPYTREEMTAELDALEKRSLFTSEERSLLDDDALFSFFQSPLGQEVVSHADQVERERSFTLRIPSKDPTEDALIVDGQVDLFVELADELWLLDFKTDRYPNPKRYQKQLSYYKEALEQAYDKKVTRAYLYWIRSKKADPVPLLESLKD